MLHQSSPRPSCLIPTGSGLPSVEEKREKKKEEDKDGDAKHGHGRAVQYKYTHHELTTTATTTTTTIAQENASDTNFTAKDNLISLTIHPSIH